jgi:hypothetical protein
MKKTIKKVLLFLVLAAMTPGVGCSIGGGGGFDIFWPF